VRTSKATKKAFKEKGRLFHYLRGGTSGERGLLIRGGGWTKLEHKKKAAFLNRGKRRTFEPSLSRRFRARPFPDQGIQGTCRTEVRERWKKESSGCSLGRRVLPVGNMLQLQKRDTIRHGKPDSACRKENRKCLRHVLFHERN